MSRPSALAVFTKLPEPGRVKTRLVPLVSSDVAARIHRACIEDTLRLAHRAPVGDAYLYVAGSLPHARALAATLPFGDRWRVSLQRGRDLGARMRHAFAELFHRGHDKAIIIGTDTPWMSPRRIAQALRALQTSDVVLGPTLDGGYYLIGARRLVPQLFRGIPWSTSRVLESTLRALRAARVPCRLIPRDFDLDRPDDLRRAERLLRRNPGRAPALARILAGNL